MAYSVDSDQTDNFPGIASCFAGSAGLASVTVLMIIFGKYELLRKCIDFTILIKPICYSGQSWELDGAFKA